LVKEQSRKLIAGAKMESKMIYLVRHGKIKLVDTERRYIGQLDLTLTVEGYKQAQALSSQLSLEKIDAVYCSDLSRCMSTAKVIADRHGLIPKARTDLREISLGKWEGLSFSDGARRFPEEFKQRGEDIGYFRPPDGESFADCRNRVLAAFADILQSPFNHIVIVGHAGINRLIICHMLGIPLNNLFTISQDYGCLNILKVANFGYRVKLLNSTSHLNQGGLDNDG
jgi:alpha-ribazole phosphatase